MPKSSETFLSRIFRAYAHAIYARPTTIIVLSALITAAFASGILFAGLQIDANPEKIWVPEASITAQQERFFDAAFDPFFRVNQAIIALQAGVPSDDVNLAQSVGWAAPAGSTRVALGSGAILRTIGNASDPAGILQLPYFQALYDLQQLVANTSASDGTVLDDICYKPIAGKGCLVESPLDYFRNNITAIQQLTPPLIQDALACRHILGQTTIPCMSEIGVPVQPEVVLGGTGCPSSPIPGFNQSICGGCGNAAQALVLTYLLQDTPELTDKGALWEHDVFLPLVSQFAGAHAGELATSYMAQRSIQDELTIVNTQNAFVVGVSYIAMLFYIAFALGKFPHPVATRSLLGLQGVVIVASSVLAALGIAAWTGLHITMIVTEVVPFLILAVGVDNMFIMTKGLDRLWWGPVGRRGVGSASAGAGGGADIRTSIGDAMAEVGPTITAAACCEVMAFMVGLVTGVPALQQFCAVAASAVAIDFALQLTWFLPALILDAHRQEARRADILPCIRVRGVGVAVGAVDKTRCACPMLGCGDGIGSARDAHEDNDSDRGPHAEALLGVGSDSDGIDAVDGRRRGLTIGVEQIVGHLSAIDAGLEQGYAAASSSSHPNDGSRYHSQQQQRQKVGFAPTLAFGSSPAVASSTGGGTLSRRGSRAAQLLQSPEFHRAMAASDASDGNVIITSTGASSNAAAGDAGGGRPAFSINSPVAGTAAAYATGDGTYELDDDDNVVATRDITGSGSNNNNGTCCGPRFWLCINRGGFVRRCMSRAYAPLLFHPLTRAVVIVAWLVAIGASCYGATQLQLGLEQQLVLPAGSYLRSYFDVLARLGEAGPPAYIVLQNVNYTHPNASSAIADLTASLGGLTRYIVSPVFSWVSDFETWSSASNRQYVELHPELDCPPPLDPSTSTHASRVAQYIYSIAIDSPCCQSAGYCGGQYSSDVKFLWGVPKQQNGTISVAGAEAAHTASMGVAVDGGMITESVTKQGGGRSPLISINQVPGRVYRSTTRVQHGGSDGSSDSVDGSVPVSPLSLDIDDGGCDMSVGYLTHAEVEAAIQRLHAAMAGQLLQSSPAPAPSSAAVAIDAASISIPSHLVADVLPPSFGHRVLNSAAAVAKQQQQREGAASPSSPFTTTTLIPCHVMTSRLRTQHTPLRNQSDFINSMQHTQAAVATLQSALPTVDLSMLGISGYGPLQPGQPLNTSVNGSAYTSDNEHTAWLPPAPGGAAFPYSLVYVYYDQYSIIRGVTVTMTATAIAAVFGASYVVAAPSVAAVTALMVTSVVVTLVGWVWLLNPAAGASDEFGGGPYGVDINAVSVVNLVTAAGLAVEFIIHIASAYARASGVGIAQDVVVAITPTTQTGRVITPRGKEGKQRRASAVSAIDDGTGTHQQQQLTPEQQEKHASATRVERARHALVHTGSSVVTGIMLTKLCGVLILALAPSQLFRLYYFRMYLGIIVLGAFHGLAVLPALLATFGLHGA